MGLIGRLHALDYRRSHGSHAHDVQQGLILASKGINRTVLRHSRGSDRHRWLGSSAASAQFRVRSFDLRIKVGRQRCFTIPHRYHPRRSIGGDTKTTRHLSAAM